MQEPAPRFPYVEHFPPPFEAAEVSLEAYLSILDDTVAALSSAGVAFVFIGGIASTTLGRPRLTQDIDVLVRPGEEGDAMKALAGAGFATHETFPDWLFKAYKDGVVIDVLFKSSGDIYLDEEMLSRSVERRFFGRTLTVAPPEDVLVMKALAHSEPTPRYWHDALGIISRSDLDWEYLLRRARVGARRVLSLLLYAQSNDLVVPNDAIDALYRSIYGEGVDGG